MSHLVTSVRSQPVSSVRIVFLCSSLEPGRDGVGDYTRLLAQQCRALGVECCVIALHDHHLQQPSETTDGGKVLELRLPAAMSWSERVRKAVAMREKFRPDWVSLQFVPYGFNTKGIVWNLRQYLQEVVHGARLHIMFHELWIGVWHSAGWKEGIVGMLQRRAILGLVEGLKPQSVATSNGAYIAILAKYGINARKLALFGNIPIAEDSTGLPPAPELPDSFDIHPRDRCWLVVFFGTLHPEWKAEPLFSTIHRAAIATGRRVCFVSVGRLGVTGEKKWALMAEQYARSFSFVALGEREPEWASRLFQAADFGIAASPWQLIGKSGSAMAMLEHGLPVIANRDEWKTRGIDANAEAQDPLLHRCDGLLEDKLIAGLAKRAPRSRVQEIAGQFVESLRLKTEDWRTPLTAVA